MIPATEQCKVNQFNIWTQSGGNDRVIGVICKLSFHEEYTRLTVIHQTFFNTCQCKSFLLPIGQHRPLQFLHYIRPLFTRSLKSFPVIELLSHPTPQNPNLVTLLLLSRNYSTSRFSSLFHCSSSPTCS